uniref:Uncharacterized protein n=1 Tax=Arundo donax TaxID=35708 RepID=A0A0A9B7G7_ARUDO
MRHAPGTDTDYSTTYQLSLVLNPLTTSGVERGRQLSLWFRKQEMISTHLSSWKFS